MGSRLEANSNAVRKRIEKHRFENEEGEEYEPSKFGGFTDYFRRKKVKLQNLDAERRSQGTNDPIFRGVVAHVNGYTQPSLNDLHTLIVSYGGGFMQYLDGKTTVTHIIASNLTPKKKVEFSRYRIVKPAWVVDSIQAGKLLPWDAYRVVHEGVGQRLLGFENGNVTSQINNHQKGYREQTDTSWYTSQVKGVADELDGPSTQTLPQGIQEPRLVQSIESESQNAPSKPIDEPSSDLKSFRPVSAETRDKSVDSARVDVFDHQNAIRTFIDPIDSEIAPAANASLTGSLSNTQQEGEQVPSESSRSPSTLKLSPFLDVSSVHPDHSPNDMNGVSQPPVFPIEDGQDVLGNIQTSDIVPKRLEEMTAEDHNAILLADPKVWKSTVVNPGFLKQYYEESRLHHLSAWKAQLKSQIQAMAVEKSSSQKAREKRPPGARRYILHADFDSFFVAVSLKKHPEYADKPVVVAHGAGAGAEIASCNYPARKFGVKNGMWMKHAQKMCSDLKVLPYDFKAYEEASRQFYEAVIDTGGIVQSVSIDEALIDISLQCIAAGGHHGVGVHEGSIWREQDKADEIAQSMRSEVKERTGCAISVGIGGNILLAKVALRKAKPAGQYHIKPAEALDFLADLTMQDLPGIAYSIGGKLEEIGVKYVKDVRQLSKERMISVLGPKTGEKIWGYSRGIDQTEVGDQVIRKSVSAEVNWGIRFVTQEQAEEFIQSLCDELHKRLLNEGVKGRQLTTKIMRRAADAPLDPPKHLGHGKCDTFNKSILLGVATNDALVIGREAISILRGWGFSPGELRGIGCQMQKLEPLKSVTDGLNDSSQKRLQFKTSNSAKPAPFSHTDNTNVGDNESFQSSKAQARAHPAAAFAQNNFPGSKSATALNSIGTEFGVSAQKDLDILSDGPQVVREASEAKPLQPPAPDTRSETSSPTPKLEKTFPSHSQIDLETLEALPDDVRAEVLAHYTNSPKKSHNQAILPQSPRKDRAIRLPKKLTTPTKKRGRPLGMGNKPWSKSALSTLTQSNFVTSTAKTSTSKAPAIEAEDVPLDPDFLSALPPDIRSEVLAQARRDRLQKTGSLNLPASKCRAAKNAPQPPAGQRMLKLPVQPEKPSFTSQKITELPGLREAINSWYEEFEEDGPYAEDVGALATYLERVVVEEGDMAKAVAVVRWLKWVANGGKEHDVTREEEQMSWTDAVARVEDSLQNAVKVRGLGRLEI